MNIPKDVQQIADILKQSGYESYLVGGCVRDFILGKEPNDWDFCTNAVPDQIIKTLEENSIPYLTIGKEYGTIVAMLNNEEYEITTYRYDGNYSDGRRPDSVTFASDIKDDLARRDFTINAIAYDVMNNVFVDPFHGQEDLKTGTLRAVGDADTRIKEDALRILRALRFAIRYELTIDNALKDAVLSNKETINHISKERITNEFHKIFKSGHKIHDIFMEYKDIIGVIIPELKPCMHFNQNNRYHNHDVYEHILNVTDNCETTKFEIKMAALMHDIGKPDTYSMDEFGEGHFYGHAKKSREISENVLHNDFRVTAKECSHILELVEYHDLEIPPSRKTVKRMLNKHGEEFIRNFAILKQADIDDHINIKDERGIPIVAWADISFLLPALEEILQADECFSLKNLQINGADLIKIFNMRPGKEIGNTLNTLFELVLNETIPNTKESLLNAADALLNQKDAAFTPPVMEEEFELE